MKRGDVWWVDFDPPLGGEIRKTRPADVVSNDSANRGLNRVQVVPLTSKTDRLYPCEAYVTLNDSISEAMADQITTVPKQRMRKQICTLSSADMADVDRAITTTTRSIVLTATWKSVLRHESNPAKFVRCDTLRSV